MKIIFIVCLLLGMISCELEKNKQIMHSTEAEDRSRYVARDMAYTKLSDKISEYRMLLVNSEMDFKRADYQFNIPFFKISPVLDDITGGAQDSVYASLGYNLDVIKKLEMFFSKLDLQDPPAANEDTAVAMKLLVFLKEITDLVKVTLNKHLSEERLAEAVANNGRGVILKIDSLVDKIMNMRDNLIVKIIEEIERVNIKREEEQNILDKLSNIFANNDEIKRLVECIKNLADQIESLTLSQ
ncbi:hypothetical protein [Borrelia coriaceae]|nr:hypothetical protein [Borrelia coriaceae]